MAYDVVADSYDRHFQRPVDRWEDARLASLLHPYADGRDVLDLGCGTGWLADHLSPASYTGVDESTSMLAELGRKHPRATVRKVSVGQRGWHRELPDGQWDLIAATWAADYFPNLPELLAEAMLRVRAGGVLALHGTQPRGHRRRHFVLREAPYFPLDPDTVGRAARAAGLGPPVSYGIGALPDPLAVTRRLWTALLAVPVGWHYSALHVWSRP